ncbi:hypothetical protein PUR23_27880 [Methylorubrum populi]|jgi:hypothetical protein|uniref:hypothetical protein n=1 Tax=Methylobacteriaceae TaxID=119045 RepID=UPI0025D17ED1|nr:hypothetical protein [Methylobacterium sp.]MBY0256264.1 hypothetical protein [Methylobacterium sp.]MDV2986849.1 hypothetical protein [Methylobacteriaceae bacterium AG10]
MIRRSIVLAAGLLLAGFGSAQAEPITLPAGDWGYSPASPADCKRPPLTIEKDRLIQRIDQEGVRGEARCKILKIKKQPKGIIFVDTKCDWDAHVPQGMRESPDNENDDSFSLKVIDKTKILFNNTQYALCSSKKVSGND